MVSRNGQRNDQEGGFVQAILAIWILTDGFITDRKKDLFKLSTGKYVAPQPIENGLTKSPFIDQAVVVGIERKFCIALLYPDFANSRAFR